MILSVRRLSYSELKKSLNKQQKIVVLSCNNCAKKCLGLGGRVGLKALSDKLEKDGFNLIHRELVGFACSVDLVSKRGKEESTREYFSQADVILTLACEDGEHAVANAFPAVSVPKLNRTLGIGWGSPSLGVRLTHPISGITLEIDLPEGIPLDEAAKKLNLESGSF